MSNYLPVRPDWLALAPEPALDPALPIVDAHHHLWDRPGWRYLAPDLQADIDGSGHTVTDTIYMQAQTSYRTDGPAELRPVGEVGYAAAQYDPASPTRLCAAIVGHADLRRGAAVAAVLQAQVEAGAGRFRGIRHITAWDADASLLNPLSAGPPALLADPAFREGFAQLAPLGLSFDAWLFHPQIDELTALARAHPDTAIILDHCGGIVRIGAYAGRDDFAAWSRAIRTLATCPNVSVKLGGLGMRINGFGFDRQPAPPASATLAATWKPWIDTCIDAFGPGRCMFQSNFPVDKGSYPYGTVWNAFKRLAAGLTPDDRAALFGGTAARIYRLPPRP